MPTYKRRPDTVEAIVYTGGNVEEVLAWAKERGAPVDLSAPVKWEYSHYRGQKMFWVPDIAPGSSWGMCINDYLVDAGCGRFLRMTSEIFCAIYGPA